MSSGVKCTKTNILQIQQVCECANLTCWSTKNLISVTQKSLWSLSSYFFRVIARPQNIILAPVDDSGTMKELCSDTCLSSVTSKMKKAATKPPPKEGPSSQCRMCARCCYVRKRNKVNYSELCFICIRDCSAFVMNCLRILRQCWRRVFVTIKKKSCRISPSLYFKTCCYYYHVHNIFL